MNRPNSDANEERARVIAWLRRSGQLHAPLKRLLADAIERGEHWQEPLERISLKEAFDRLAKIEKETNPQTELDEYGYPKDWPKCPGCGLPALDGHITCGQVGCDEAGRR